MKRLIPVLLCLALLLCGCAQKKTVFTVEQDGVTLTINTKELTVSDGTNDYRYYSASAEGGNRHYVSISIIYPDDSSYNWSAEKENGIIVSSEGSGSEDYDAERYIAGEILAAAMAQIEGTSGKSVNWYNIIVGIICIVLGVLGLIFPHAFFRLRYFLYVYDPEPTEFAMGMSYLTYGLFILIGMISIITGL